MRGSLILIATGMVDAANMDKGLNRSRVMDNTGRDGHEHRHQRQNGGKTMKCRKSDGKSEHGAGTMA